MLDEKEKGIVKTSNASLHSGCDVTIIGDPNDEVMKKVKQLLEAEGITVQISLDYPTTSPPTR